MYDIHFKYALFLNETHYRYVFMSFTWGHTTQRPLFGGGFFYKLDLGFKFLFKLLLIFGSCALSSKWGCMRLNLISPINCEHIISLFGHIG